MAVPNQLKLCLHDQTMLPVEWKASNFLAGWLATFVSLLFIVIPISFLNFYLFLHMYIDINKILKI